MFLLSAATFIALCKTISMIPTAAVETVLEKYSSPCEDEWKQYDQHCYKVSKNEYSWREASVRCKEEGGYLASIHSKEQNDFFEEFSTNTGNSYWWIGLHDHEIEGVFVWADGSDVDYTNWKPGEPMGEYYHSGNCVAKSFIINNPGRWYVLGCHRKLPYLCQKKIATPFITTTEMCETFISNVVSTSTEMPERVNTIPLITKSESDDRNVTTSRITSVGRHAKTGSMSVTIFIVTLVIVAAFIVLLGGICYYKRSWLKETRLKAGSVFFRKN